MRKLPHQEGALRDCSKRQGLFKVAVHAQASRK